MTQDNHIVYAIKIAGIGVSNSDYGGDVDPADISSDPGPNTLLQRFTSTLCAQDPNQYVVRNYLMSLPNEVSYEIKPWESEAITGSMSFSLIGNPQTIEMGSRQSFPISGRLLTSINSTDTTLVTDAYSGELEGTYQYIGKECIYFHTAEVTPGEYSVFRGQLFTGAVLHRVSPEYDTAIYRADKPHNLPGRRVELVRFVNGTGLIEDDEEYIWSGVIRSYTLNYEKLTLDFECASYEDILREGEICVSPWTGALVEGSLSIPEEPYNVLGRYEKIGGPNTFLGSTSLSYVDPDGNEISSTSAIFSDGETTFSGKIFGVNVLAPINYNNYSSPTPLASKRSELSGTVHEVYNLAASASTIGALIYQICTRSDDRGLAIDPSVISDGFVEKLNNYVPQTYFPTSLMVGIDGPQNVYELITSLLKPYLVTIYVNSAGKIDALPLVDRLLISSFDLDGDDLIEDSNIKYNSIGVAPAAKINTSSGEMVGTKNPLKLSVISPQVRDRYPDTFTTKVDLQFPGSLDPVLAQSVALNYSAFRAQVRPTFEIDTLVDVNLWPGQTVRVTLPELPNSEGLITDDGTQEICTVLMRAYNHESLNVRYKLLRGNTGIRRGAIHLSALVNNYVEGTGACFIVDDTFISTANNHPEGWDNDLNAWNAVMQAVFNAGGSDILVDILDENLTQIGTAKVFQVFEPPVATPGYLQLSDATINPSSGDYIVPRSYTDAEGNNEILFDYFVYIADNSNLLGSDDDPAFQWSI